MKGDEGPGDYDTSNPALWDDIEAKYWASMRSWRLEEDRKLETKYETQRKHLNHTQLSLQNSRAQLVAERLQLLEKLKAIDREVTEMDGETAAIEDSLQDLNRKMEDERATFAHQRTKDDEEKREMFVRYRLAGTMESNAHTSDMPVRTTKSGNYDDAAGNGVFNGDEDANVNGTQIGAPQNGDNAESDDATISPTTDPSYDEDQIMEDLPMAEAIPAEAIPAEAMPTEAKPTGAMPTEAMPIEAIPTEAIPAEATPAEAIPTEAIPSIDDSGGIDVIGEPGETLAAAETQSVSMSLSSQLSTPLSEPELPLDLELSQQDQTQPMSPVESPQPETREPSEPSEQPEPLGPSEPSGPSESTAEPRELKRHLELDESSSLSESMQIDSPENDTPEQTSQSMEIEQPKPVEEPKQSEEPKDPKQPGESKEPEQERELVQPGEPEKPYQAEQSKNPEQPDAQKSAETPKEHRQVDDKTPEEVEVSKKPAQQAQPESAVPPQATEEPEQLAEADQPEPAPDSADTKDPASKVVVMDGTGKYVGRLRCIKLDNHWTKTVLSLPIKRHVQIRTGRKFNEDTLASVYEPSDVKGAKWLSCFIQATGEVQTHPCQTCAKAMGPFQECILLGGGDFPRCGNCEWNRQGCNLQPRPKSRLSMSSEAAGLNKSPRKSLAVHAKQSSQPAAGFPVANPSNHNTRKSNIGGVADEMDMTEAPSEKKAAEKLLTRKLTSEVKKQGSRTPSTMTPLSGSPAPDADEEDTHLGPINKETLVLRDDGVKFTHPPCMRDVPLAKIDPKHPYWEEDWLPIEEIIGPKLQEWKDKYDEHVASGSGPPSSKFMANRQVNRGKIIMKFLDEGEICPYQIIGKSYINKQLVNYDTLYRMAQVIEELGKFNIDVTPTQWLRQRLHELCLEEGDGFNLAKTLSGFYHDPKVTALRTKSGFGNIGRPSGYRASDKGTPEGSKKITTRGKRKAPHATPKASPSTEAGPSRPRSSRREPRSPVDRVKASLELKPDTSTTRESKKPRLEQQQFEPARAEDLEYEGYTTSDSYSEDNVMQVDWRVYQVKTRDQSSGTSVTQYWHWVDKADGGSQVNMFEHQVLRSVRSHKVSWGVYKEPIDFHLRLTELTTVTFATNYQKIIIGTKPIKGVTYRGDVLAHFKRERTKRRFLAFVKKKGVKLQKASP